MDSAEHLPIKRNAPEKAQEEEEEPAQPMSVGIEASIGSLEDYEKVYPSLNTARRARLGDIIWGAAMNDVINDPPPKNHPDERGL